METGTLITAAIMIAIFVSPFVLIYRFKTKRAKDALKSINEFADQHKCTITTSEFCGDVVIGIDENKNYLFYIQRMKDQPFKKHIDLSSVQRCRINNVTKSRNNADTNYNTHELIELCFTPVDAGGKEVRLELFNSNGSKQQTNEIQLAEKWSRLINERLKSVK